MTVQEQLLWWALAILGLGGSWLCSGLETGAYMLNRVKLEIRAGQRSRRALILQRELGDGERLLATLLISNNIFNYLVAMATTALLSGWGYSSWAIVGINALLLTPVLFVFAESVPKELFRQEADRLTYALSWVIPTLRLGLTVGLVLPLIGAVGRIVSRLLGGGPGVTLGSARERVAAMLKETAEHGVLSAEQATLIDRALVFSRTTAGAEMTPWSRAPLVQIEWDRSRMLRFMAAQPWSAFPVVDRRGTLIGIVRPLHVAAFHDTPVRDLVSEPVRISERSLAHDALMRLGQAGAELGIVESEGRIAGIVTLRGLVEPLTGELPAW